MLSAAPTAPALPSPAPDGDACLIALLDARLCGFEAEFGRLNPLVGIAVAQHSMTGISGAQSEAINAWAGAVASLFAQVTADLCALNDQLHAAL